MSGIGTFSNGPLVGEDDFMHDMLNVNPRAVIRRVKQFRCGSNTNIELFEYESPDQRREMPKTVTGAGTISRSMWMILIWLWLI